MTIRIGWTFDEGDTRTTGLVVVETRPPVVRHFVVGLARYSRRRLELLRERGARSLRLRVVGVLWFADDVTPDLLDGFLDEVRLAGTLRAPEDVRALLAAA